MATIEQLEVQLTGKLSMAEQKLERFNDNLGKIGSIIGKNPTYVYDLLLAKHTEISNSFNGAVNVNTDFLSGLIEREDKVLAVLNEVDAVIDRIENSPDDQAIDVKNEATEEMTNIAEGIESRLEDSGVAPNLFGSIIPGLASYTLLRYVAKAGQTVSLVAAGVVSLILRKK